MIAVDCQEERHQYLNGLMAEVLEEYVSVV